MVCRRVGGDDGLALVRIGTFIFVWLTCRSALLCVQMGGHQLRRAGPCLVRPSGGRVRMSVLLQWVVRMPSLPLVDDHRLWVLCVVSASVEIPHASPIAAKSPLSRPRAASSLSNASSVSSTSASMRCNVCQESLSVVKGCQALVSSRCCCCVVVLLLLLLLLLLLFFLSLVLSLLLLSSSLPVS